MFNKYILTPLLGIGLLLGSSAACADSIDPLSYSDTLAVGESVTITKTVTVDTVTSGVLDVVFLFDTSGSMGPFINAAQTAAEDILDGLNAFGDVASGTGYYSEGSGLGLDGVFRPLTTDPAQQIQNINDISLGLGGGGGDFPEKGFAGTKDAAENSAWRTASNRFVIALGDATFKESDGATLANTTAALLDNNTTFIGIDFANMTRDDFGGIDPTPMAIDTGGAMFTASSDPATIVTAIVDSVTGVFAEYDAVTVDDLGAGLPGVDVSVVCTGADVGACNGASAEGNYDRTSTRVFTFDVTFTGLAEGTHAFDTHALIDGGIVASEADTITVGDGGGPAVPAPATLLLMGLGLVGMGAARRRRAA